MNPKAFKYQVSQESRTMPEINTANKSNLADGNIDPTFNASVTEGDGYIAESVVQPDGKIIIGGYFQRVGGVRLNGIARLNADGTLDTSFNTGSGASSAVRAIALQPDGKIILGGAFTSFNGQTVSRIVRLNADGSIDSSFSLTVNINNQINDIAVLADGKILIGGAFTLLSSRLAILNSDGTLNGGLLTSSTVYKIIVQPDGKILVGGAFSGRVMRLNADFSHDPTLSLPTAAINQTVTQMALQTDGKIILGGNFTSFNGTTTDNIVRITSTGSLDSAFNFLSDEDAQNNQLDALALQPDGKILASYDYATDDEFVGRVVRFNTDATLDNTFTNGDINESFAPSLTVLADGKVLVGGDFVSYNDQARFYLVKLNQDGTLDNAFNCSVSSAGIVLAIEQQTDGKIVIAGDFRFVNGVRKNAIARLNANGTLDDTFSISSGFVGYISDVEIQPDGKIVIGGLFAGVSSFPAYGAARLNSNGSFDVTLNFDTNFVSSATDIELQPDGKILIGGFIFNSSFSSLVAAIRTNSNGTLDTGFTPPVVNGTVRALHIQPDGKILVGGLFTPINPDFPRAGLARLNANGTFDSSFIGSCPSTLSLAGMPDGSFFAGGGFIGCNGVNGFGYIVRLTVEGVINTTFNSAGKATNGVNTIEVQPDGKVIIGGTFLTYDGVTVNRIARINANGTLDATFNSGSGATATVQSLKLQNDGKLLVGGFFLDFNNTEKFGIVRLQNAAVAKPVPFDFDGDRKTDISIFRPAVGEWWYSRSSDGQVPAAQFGTGTDKIVPGDYSGDGKTDIAVWRPASGEWLIARSEDGSYYSVPFGQTGDIPAPADYDVDGKIDLAVFRPSSGTWFIQKSTGGTVIVNFGTNGDVPVAADYDGDNRADIAIFRPSDGSWWYVRSIDGEFRVFSFGVSTDKPVAGDYTGDGKADIAVFRPSTGEWFFQRSEDNSYYSLPFGQAGDIPAPGDFDGDGRFDTAVFRPSTANWYVQRSSAGLLIQQFGLSTDMPVPSAFVP